MRSTPQLAGVNAFLDAVYAPGARLSTLLAACEYSETEIAVLREHQLQSLVEAFVLAIGDRIRRYNYGERRYILLLRRFGLDGMPPDGIEAVAAQLGISLGQARRLEASTLRRCRSGKNRAYWQESAGHIAEALLSGRPAREEAQAPGVTIMPHTMPFQQVASAPRMSSGEASAPLTRSLHVDVTRPIPVATGEEVGGDGQPSTAERVSAAVTTVLEGVGHAIHVDAVTRILGGDREPVVEALVRRHELVALYGCCADLDRNRLRELVRDARRERALPAEQSEGTRAGEPSLDQVERLVDGIRQRAGQRTPSMYAHVLNGNTGPKVEALVRTYGVPEYGALHALGYRRIKELVHDALQQARAPSGALIPGARAADLPAPPPCGLSGYASLSSAAQVLGALSACGDGLPAADVMRQVLTWCAERSAQDAAGADATLDRWLRVNRGRPVASWLWLADSRAGHGADSRELGAMVCQLVLAARDEQDVKKKALIAEAILSRTPADVDCAGRAPAGRAMEQIRAAFAELPVNEATRGRKDLWLAHLEAQPGGAATRGPRSR